MAGTRNGRQSSSTKGARGETKASQYLSGRGYAVIARNFRSRTGEIDIIAQKDGVLAFIEVKTWGTLTEADLEYSIGRTKRRRIAETARLFMARRPEFAGMRTRFDVVFCRGGDSDAGVRHIENAFGGAIE
jgi:putative endonuclease